MSTTKAVSHVVVEEGCSVFGIHSNLIRTAQDRMPRSEDFENLAEFYKLFGDKTRLGIIWALAVCDLCVCDLCALLQMSQSAISHQLRTLKQARIVKSRREGKVVFYALDDEHIRNVLDVGYSHITER